MQTWVFFLLLNSLTFPISPPPIGFFLLFWLSLFLYLQKSAWLYASQTNVVLWPTMMRTYCVPCLTHQMPFQSFKYLGLLMFQKCIRHFVVILEPQERNITLLIQDWSCALSLREGNTVKSTCFTKDTEETPL